jgi:hypothetical protein
MWRAGKAFLTGGTNYRLLTRCIVALSYIMHDKRTVNWGKRPILVFKSW